MAPLLARRPAADRAFERLYQRHVGDVYRYVHAVLRNPDDAEDVTQTTFMNAYRAFQRGERPDAPKNWLIAIAHNVCRQRFRQQQRRPSELPLFEDSAELAVEEPEHEYSAEDIQRALGQLAFNQRAALVMRELEGRSYKEIAEIMGMTVGAVETLIFRGRRALREQLEGSLTCSQAELALSKQADGMLSRGERGQLRAHLRECKECEALARRQRATRGAIKGLLGAIPLPTSLASFFGGGGSAIGIGAGLGAGAAVKAAAVVVAGSFVAVGGYEGARHVHATPVAAQSRQTLAAVGVATHAPVQSVFRATPLAASTHAAAAHAKPAKAAKTAKAQKTKVHTPPPGASVAAAAKQRGHGRGHEPMNPVARPAHESENPARARREPTNPVARPPKAARPRAKAKKDEHPQPVQKHVQQPRTAPAPTPPGQSADKPKKQDPPATTAAATLPALPTLPTLPTLETATIPPIVVEHPKGPGPRK